MARLIQMTAMPQMVAVFNGLGGAASALVAAGVLHGNIADGTDMSLDVPVTIMIGTLIGTVTFSGSLIAYGKLQEIVATRPVTFPLQKTVSLVLFVGILALMGYLVAEPDMTLFIVLGAACLLLGILLVIPIGGADMPVVISMLNSYSGWAACGIGFTLQNTALIIVGALVGSSGAILSYIMCVGMNRSIFNVMLGGFGGEVAGPAAGAGGDDRPVKSGSADDAAFLMKNANKVIIVPGYGMAVAQAQHAPARDGRQAEGRGRRSGLRHPSRGGPYARPYERAAGGGPTYPYDEVFELEDINSEFSQADVAFVIGANDVTNPAAKTDPTSPIFGMPILDVENAGTVLFIKRSLGSG